MGANKTRFLLSRSRPLKEDLDPITSIYIPETNTLIPEIYPKTASLFINSGYYKISNLTRVYLGYKSINFEYVYRGYRV